MAASTDQVASKCIDGYGSAIGMPQLCGDWMANQIFLVSCYASNNLFNSFENSVAANCRSAGRPAKHNYQLFNRV